ncbi:MAG: adenylosuccinate synthase [Alphaproteobacteria bacterium]|nr:adenylosuccinate synthase [Alphaproteobacteria bacterium]
MMLISIVGLQWGDEGKGKIVDFLSDNSDVVVRFQGGHNAGHTIVVEDTTYKLSLLPSNILREGKISVIGNGVVVDPFHLIKEIAQIEAQGIKIADEQLIIAENANLILPLHQTIDEVCEKIRSNEKIGTTKRGIGPAYADKVSRKNIRVCDLADFDIVERKIDELLKFYGPILTSINNVTVSKAEILQKLKEIAPQILKYAKPAWKLLNDYKKQGKTIMFEGAQGVMLDNDYGTYPYVTSSNTITSQAFTGSGVGCDKIDHNIAIVKAYTTRVGEGPFPTELFDDIGQHLQEKGHEFGTVTGRDRRCGWLDLVQLKQMITICGINSIALTKLDVMSELNNLKICYKYKALDGTEYDYLPASQKLQASLTPIYTEMPGWNSDISSIKNYGDLPENAKKYIEFIANKLEVTIDIVSTGPARSATIIRKDFFAKTNS